MYINLQKCNPVRDEYFIKLTVGVCRFCPRGSATIDRSQWVSDIALNCLVTRRSVMSTPLLDHSCVRITGLSDIFLIVFSLKVKCVYFSVRLFLCFLSVLRPRAGTDVGYEQRKLQNKQKKISMKNVFLWNFLLIVLWSQRSCNALY
jgi:hypothetical protein